MLSLARSASLLRESLECKSYSMQTLTSKILTTGQHAILRQAGQIPIGSVV